MSLNPGTRHVKRVTLTSKKNWWMVELDDEEQDDHLQNKPPIPYNTQQTIVSDSQYYRPPQPQRTDTRMTAHAHSPEATTSIFSPPMNPASIFSFPTPTSYSAPPNPSQNLAPFATGSASELFKCVVKKPNIVQLEINGEMQSNARDVATQFLAELRVYTTVTRHRNIAAFLGSLENVGMVLEFIEGRTLWDVIQEQPKLTRAKKLDFHNQLLDGLTHLHSFGLSHGDLSLLNIQVTHSSDTIKLLDFGRSVAADSIYASPDDDIEEISLSQTVSPPPRSTRFGITPPSRAITPPPPAIPSRKIEQIQPGTRPFSAPEVLRGECQDARLADAYSFGMILVCLDRCEHVDVKPWDQRKDLLPKGFLDGLEVFGERCMQYLRRWDNGRRRLLTEDMMDEDVQMDLK